MNLHTISLVQDGIETFQEAVYDIKEELMESGARNVKLSGFLEDAIHRLNIDLGKAFHTDMFGHKANKEFEMKKMLMTICRCAKVKVKDLMKDRSRRRLYVMPKQIHMTVLNVLFDTSLALAGSLYERDHATVMHAKKTVRDLYHTSRSFREQYSQVFDLCMAYDSGKFIKYLNDDKEEADK